VINSRHSVYTKFSSLISMYFNNVYSVSSIVRKNDAIIRIKNFPVFGEKLADIYLTIPRETLDVQNNNIIFNSLEQSHINIIQKINGQEESFIHPHIYTNGTPCLHKKKIEDVESLFSWFIRCLVFQNVSKETVEIGFLANTINFSGSYDEDVKPKIDKHISYLKTLIGQQTKFVDQIVDTDYRATKNFFSVRWI